MEGYNEITKMEVSKFEHLCRCCHSEGEFKSLIEPYDSAPKDVNNSKNSSVIYTNLLQECFSIQILPAVDPNKDMNAICGQCIQKLQDAVNFKLQVQTCEQTFWMQYYQTVPSGIEKDETENEEGIIISRRKDKITNTACRKERGKKSIRHSKQSFTDEELCTDNMYLEENCKLKQNTKSESKIKAKRKNILKNIAAINIKTMDEKQETKSEQPPPFKMQKDIDYTKIKKLYYCSRCDTRNTSSYKLKEHIKYKHLNMPRYSCPKCSQVFQTLAPFVKHKFEEHKIDDRFICKACDRVFHVKEHLTNHLKSFHMLGDKVKCEICSFETFNRITMSRHKFKHRTVKEFHCRFCKKSFLRKGTLMFHERIHTGDKRKVCKECGEAFVQKASLNYHMAKYHPGVTF